MNTNDPSLPSYVRPEVVAARPDLDLMADFLAGTRRVWDRAEGAKYLKKWADEQPTTYAIRRESETVFEGLGRVLSASVGMLFARAPRVEWNASEVAFEESWENLDGMGNNGDVLAKRFAEQAIRDGFGMILVDHPQAPDGVQVTAANEVSLGLRPAFALYQRAQLISWRWDVVNNTPRLTQAVLQETSNEPASIYGIRACVRYRVLRLVDGVASWELWEESTAAGAGGFAKINEGTFRNRAGATSDVIPLAIGYTGRSDAPCTATIPLLGVAWANLAHWRLSTALTFAREVASYAQGVVIGELAPIVGANGATQAARIKLGPLALIHLQGEGASFEWKSPPVDAFAPLERGIQEKLSQIGQMGMSFMVTDTRAAETAEAKRLDATAENSTLATAAQGIEDAWNQAMMFMAWYLGIEAAGAPELTINTDFDAVTIDAATMVAYVTAVKDAGLPERLLLEAWQQGGRIPADTDLDALEAEMMANAQAAADQAAEDAAARAATMGAVVGGAGPGPSAPPKPRKLNITRGADGKASGIEEV